MLLPSRPARFCPAAHQRGRAPSRRQWLKPGANDHPWAIRRAAGFVIQVSSATFGDISNDQMTSTLTIDSGGVGQDTSDEGAAQVLHLAISLAVPLTHHWPWLLLVPWVGLSR